MSDRAAEARLDAGDAADRADIVVAEVSTPDELDELRGTMERIWGPEVVPPRNLLRGMAIGGAGLLVARRGDDCVGFALGWLGWHDGIHLHSHQVGVVGGTRGNGVGFALKLAQRAQALQHGITDMHWTFDPLLRTNARFNLRRLGAEVIAFLPHCYGDRRDAFNTGDVTDRVEVSWRLDRPVGGEPVEPTSADQLIEIPFDYHALREADPGSASEARASVGRALAMALDRGERVLGIHESPDGRTVSYVVGPERG